MCVFVCILYCGLGFSCVIHDIINSLVFSTQITSSQSATLLVGARLPRSFNFEGTINQVVFFESILTPEFIQQIQQEFPGLVNPLGSCRPYLQNTQVCPTPRTAPSTLCVSSIEK